MQRGVRRSRGRRCCCRYPNKFVILNPAPSRVRDLTAAGSEYAAGTFERAVSDLFIATMLAEVVRSLAAAQDNTIMITRPIGRISPARFSARARTPRAIRAAGRWRPGNA